MNRSDLKPIDALLVGTMYHDVAYRHMPVVNIRVKCPHCGNVNYHSWGVTEMDEVEHRAAHCRPNCPLKKGGYFIGLDPEKVDRHQRFFRDYLRRYAKWEGQQLISQTKSDTGEVHL